MRLSPLPQPTELVFHADNIAMALKRTSPEIAQGMPRLQTSATQMAAELTSCQGRGQEQQRDQVQNRHDLRWSQLLQQLVVQSESLLAGELGNPRKIERRAEPEQPGQTQQKPAAEYLIDLLFRMKAIGLLDYQRIGKILEQFPAEQSQLIADLKNTLKGKGPARATGQDQSSEMTNLMDHLKRFESQHERDQAQQQGRELLASQQQRDQLQRQREQLRALLERARAQKLVFEDGPGRSPPSISDGQIHKSVQEVGAEFQLLESLPNQYPALILACRVGEKLGRLVSIQKQEVGIQIKHAPKPPRAQHQPSSEQRQGVSHQQQAELLALVHQMEAQMAFLGTVPKKGQIARQYDLTRPELRLIKARIETLQTEDQALVAGRQLRKLLDGLSQMAKDLQQNRRQPKTQSRQSLSAQSQQGAPTERAVESNFEKACCRIS